MRRVKEFKYLESLLQIKENIWNQIFIKSIKAPLIGFIDKYIVVYKI